MGSPTAKRTLSTTKGCGGDGGFPHSLITGAPLHLDCTEDSGSEDGESNFNSADGCWVGRVLDVLPVAGTQPSSPTWTEEVEREEQERTAAAVATTPGAFSFDTVPVRLAACTDTRPVLRDVDLIQAVWIGRLTQAENIADTLLGMFWTSLSLKGLLERVILLQNQRWDLGEFLSKTLIAGQLQHNSPFETLSASALLWVLVVRWPRPVHLHWAAPPL